MTAEVSSSNAAIRRLSHVPALDGLRAVAILAVLVFHTAMMNPFQPNPLPGGFLGVDVFFVLSGFLISALLLGELQRGRLRVGAFYSRRALRLLPALIVALAPRRCLRSSPTLTCVTRGGRC